MTFTWEIYIWKAFLPRFDTAVQDNYYTKNANTKKGAS